MQNKAACVAIEAFLWSSSGGWRGAWGGGDVAALIGPSLQR